MSAAPKIPKHSGIDQKLTQQTFSWGVPSLSAQKLSMAQTAHHILPPQTLSKSLLQYCCNIAHQYVILARGWIISQYTLSQTLQHV